MRRSHDETNLAQEARQSNCLYFPGFAERSRYAPHTLDMLEASFALAALAEDTTCSPTALSRPRERRAMPRVSYRYARVTVYMYRDSMSRLICTPLYIDVYIYIYI